MTEHCDCLSLPPLHEAHRSVNDVWDSSEDNGSGSGETLAVKIEKEREDMAPAKAADDDGEVTELLVTQSSVRRARRVRGLGLRERSRTTRDRLTQR